MPNGTNFFNPVAFSNTHTATSLEALRELEAHAPSWPKMSLRSKLQQRTKVKRSPLPLAGEGGCRRQLGEGGPKLEGHASSWPRTRTEGHALSWPLDACVSRTAPPNASGGCKTCKFLKKADGIPGHLQPLLFSFGRTSFTTGVVRSIVGWSFAPAEADSFCFCEHFLRRDCRLCLVKHFAGRRRNRFSSFCAVPVPTFQLLLFCCFEASSVSFLSPYSACFGLNFFLCVSTFPLVPQPFLLEPISLSPATSRQKTNHKNELQKQATRKASH